MDAFWMISESTKIRIFALGENIKRKAMQLGYSNWILTSFNQLVNSIKDGYFLRLLYEYYPNKRPFGEYILANKEKKEEYIKQELENVEVSKRHALADDIHKNIQVVLTQYVKNNSNHFSPKDLQRELGLSLSIRRDVKKVTIKKITKVGQNTVRVTVDVVPIEWESNTKLSFNFDFKGISDDNM